MADPRDPQPSTTKSVEEWRSEILKYAQEGGVEDIANKPTKSVDEWRAEIRKYAKAGGADIPEDDPRLTLAAGVDAQDYAASTIPVSDESVHELEFAAYRDALAAGQEPTQATETAKAAVEKFGVVSKGPVSASAAHEIIGGYGNLGNAVVHGTIPLSAGPETQTDRDKRWVELAQQGFFAGAEEAATGGQTMTEEEAKAAGVDKPWAQKVNDFGWNVLTAPISPVTSIVAAFGGDTHGLPTFNTIGHMGDDALDIVTGYGSDPDAQKVTSGGGLTGLTARLGVNTIARPLDYLRKKSDAAIADALEQGHPEFAARLRETSKSQSQMLEDAIRIPAFDDAARVLYENNDKSAIDAVPYDEMPESLRGPINYDIVFAEAAKSDKPEFAVLAEGVKRGAARVYLENEAQHLPVGLLRAVVPDAIPADTTITDTYARRHAMQSLSGGEDMDALLRMVTAGLIKKDEVSGRPLFVPTKFQRVMAYAGGLEEVVTEADMDLSWTPTAKGVEWTAEALGYKQLADAARHARLPTKAGWDSWVATGTLDPYLEAIGLRGSKGALLRAGKGTNYFGRIGANIAMPDYQGFGLADSLRRQGVAEASPEMAAAAATDLTVDTLVPFDEMVLGPLADVGMGARRAWGGWNAAQKAGLRGVESASVAAKSALLIGGRDADEALHAAVKAGVEKKVLSGVDVTNLHGKGGTLAAVEEGAPAEEEALRRVGLVDPHIEREVLAEAAKVGIDPAELVGAVRDMAKKAAGFRVDSVAEMLARGGGPGDIVLRESPEYLRVKAAYDEGVRAGKWSQADADVALALDEQRAYQLVADGRVADPIAAFGERVVEHGGAPGEGALFSMSADDALKKLRAQGVITDAQVAQILGDGRPEYLDAVAKFILEQREKVKAGQLTNRDVAKAYVMSVASQRAGEIGTGKLARGERIKAGKITATGNQIDLPEAGRLAGERRAAMGGDAAPVTFTDVSAKGVTTVRPEELMAAWFFTPDGQRALDAIERGDVDADAWELGAKLRDTYGANTLRNEKGSIFEPPTVPGQVTLANIGEVTDALNAAKGDPEKVAAAVSRLRGIGAAKTPFVAQLLGFGEAPTIDAIELWGWLTGTPGGKPNALVDKIKKVFGTKGGPKSAAAKATDYMKKAVEGGFSRLKAAGHPGTEDLPPEVYGAVMHHWFWDKLKRAETTHEGLYAAQRYAQDVGGDVRGMIERRVYYYGGALPLAATRIVDDLDAAGFPSLAENVRGWAQEPGSLSLDEFVRGLHADVDQARAQVGSGWTDAELRKLEGRFDLLNKEDVARREGASAIGSTPEIRALDDDALAIALDDVQRKISEGEAALADDAAYAQAHEAVDRLADALRKGRVGTDAAENVESLFSRSGPTVHGSIERLPHEGALYQAEGVEPYTGPYERPLDTELPSFKQWFGESKVTTPEGAPQRMYHGSGYGDIKAFDPARMDPEGLFGPGFYFTENPEVASSYVAKEAPRHTMSVEERWLADLEKEYATWGDDMASHRLKQLEAARELASKRPATPGAGVLPVYLSVKRPFNMDAAVSPATLSDLVEGLRKVNPIAAEKMDAAISGVPVPYRYGDDIRPFKGEWAMGPVKIREERGSYFANGERYASLDEAAAAVKSEFNNMKTGEEAWGMMSAITGSTEANEALRAAGYDGIEHTGGGRFNQLDETRHRVVIAFEPEQIKSATANVGTFDPKNPSILHSRSGPTVHGSIEPAPTTPLPPVIAKRQQIVEQIEAALREAEPREAELAERERALAASGDPNDAAELAEVRTAREAKAAAREVAEGRLVKARAALDAAKEAGGLPREEAKYLIRFFGTADMRTLLHENLHLLRFQKGDKWVDELVQFFDHEPDPERVGKFRLTRKGEEQFAEAGTRMLAFRLRPNGRLRAYLDEFKDTLTDLWMRVRRLPVGVPRDFRMWFDAALEPGKYVDRLLVDVNPEGRVPDLPVVATPSNQAERAAQETVKRRGALVQDVGQQRSAGEVMDALGVTRDAAEVDALDVYARGVADAVLASAKRATGARTVGEALAAGNFSGPLRVVSPRAIVPEARAESVLAAARGRMESIFGAAPKVDPESNIVHLDEKEAAKLEQHVTYLANTGRGFESLNGPSGRALLEPGRDFTRVTLAEYEAINDATITAAAGVGSGRSIAAEKIAGNFVVSTLKAGALKAERFSAIKALSGTLKDAFTVQWKVSEYVKPHLAEVLKATTRELGDIPGWIVRTAATIKGMTPDASLEEVTRMIAKAAPPQLVEAEDVPLLAKLHDKYMPARTVGELEMAEQVQRKADARAAEAELAKAEERWAQADAKKAPTQAQLEARDAAREVAHGRIKELTDAPPTLQDMVRDLDDLSRLFGRSRIPSPAIDSAEQSALQVLATYRDWKLGELATEEREMVERSLASVYEGLRRRGEAVSNTGTQIALAMSGQPEMSVFAESPGPHARWAVYQLWHSGQWLDILAGTVREGGERTATLPYMPEGVWGGFSGKGMATASRSGFDQQAAAVAAIGRLRAQHVVTDAYARMMDLGIPLDAEAAANTGRLFERIPEIGETAQDRAMFRDDVLHYMRAISNFGVTKTLLREDRDVLDAAGKVIGTKSVIVGSMPSPGLSPRPGGRFNPEAYKAAAAILDAWGYKAGHDVEWEQVLLPNGIDVYLPKGWSGEVAEAVDRGAKAGLAWTAAADAPEKMLGPFTIGAAKQKVAHFYADAVAAAERGTPLQRAVNSTILMMMDAAGFMYSTSRIGMTTGFLIPNPSNYVGNAFGGMLQAFFGKGAVGTSRMLSLYARGGPQGEFLRQLFFGMFEEGRGLPLKNWWERRGTVWVDKRGTIHTVQSAQEDIARFGLRSSMARAESGVQLAAALKQYDGTFWSRLVNDPKLEVFVKRPVRYVQNILTEVSGAIDNFYRCAAYVDELGQGATKEEAAEVARRVAFDYGEATEFEREIMRPTVMFYMYQRRNVDLFWWTLLNRPSRVFGTLRGIRDLQKYILGDDSDLTWPDMLDGRMVVALNETDRTSPLYQSRKGMAYVLPPVPASDAVALQIRLLDALQAEPEAVRGMVSMLSPYMQAPVVLGLGIEPFSGRDVERAGVIPQWFMDMDEGLTGGRIAALTGAKWEASSDPATGEVGRWVPSSAEGSRWWWTFHTLLQLPPFGRSTDTITKMAKADELAWRFPDGIVTASKAVGGALGVEPNAAIQQQIDANNIPSAGRRRPGVTSAEELADYLGVKTVPIDTLEMAKGRLLHERQMKIDEATKAEKRNDPHRFGN